MLRYRRLISGIVSEIVLHPSMLRFATKKKMMWFAASILFVFTAQAFNPDTWYVLFVQAITGDVLGKTHGDITKSALASFRAEMGYTYTRSGMIAAADEISWFNTFVDKYDQHKAESHFDGESFQEGHRR